MSKWGSPVNPYYVLGGFIPEGEAFPEDPEDHKENNIFKKSIY